MTGFMQRHKFLFAYCVICLVFLLVVFTHGGGQ